MHLNRAIEYRPFPTSLFFNCILILFYLVSLCLKSNFEMHIIIVGHLQFLIKFLRALRFEPQEVHQVNHANAGRYGPFRGILKFRFGPWHAMTTMHRDLPVALAPSWPIGISGLGYFIGLLHPQARSDLVIGPEDERW